MANGTTSKLGCGPEALLFVGGGGGLLAAYFWSTGADPRTAVADGLTYAAGGYCALVAFIVIVVFVAAVFRR